MADLHTTYRLTITTLSPLHIGTGEILRQGYDFVTRRGQTWVINSEVLAAMLYEQDPGDFERMVQGIPAHQLLRDSDYVADSSLFRYVMRGEPRSTQQGAQVQELLKDAWDRPYIPGSSLKGALRTALAYVGWEQRRLTFHPNMLGDREKYAGQPMEQMVLNATNPPRGKEPNHDLLRAVQVSDSSPDEERRIQLLNVQVAVGEKAGSPIELEAIARDTTFTATLTLDGFLRRPEVAGQLGWGEDQLQWIQSIPRVVNHFSNQRIAAEIERWDRQGGSMRSFYATLSRLATSEIDPRREFLLQLGWGGGWDSKTFGDILTGNPQAFAQVVKKYGRTLVRQGEYKPGSLFPKSRRVVVKRDDRQAQPLTPLGWIRVRMERV